MKSFLRYSLALSATFFYLISFGQKVVNVNKEGDVNRNPARLKDTVIYEVISNLNDTFNFGMDKKLDVKGEEIITGNFNESNQRLDILFEESASNLMTLNLEIVSQKSDTIPVYSIMDPTEITRLYIIKTYNCKVKGFQVNDYEKVRQFAYYRKLLTKLIDFRNE